MMTFPIVRILPALLCLFAAFTAHGQAAAQRPGELTLAQSAAMPRWTVPVLRLVSATHVEPTTGIVLSDSGLVLVPAEFAAPGDEIIVLDGGTDIIRNGRPAKILRRYSQEGVQVLSVPTLQRRGASFAAAPLRQGDQVRLHAFPPAELIAQGEAPVDLETTINLPDENSQPLISGENPLPNVSGALVDACDNLVGYSAASGVQSMSTEEFPRYQWKDTLIRLAGELQISVKMADCRADLAEPAETPAEEPELPAEPDEPEAMPENTPEPEPESPPATEEQATEDATEPEAEEAGNTDQAEAGAETLEELEILPPLESSTDPSREADVAVADEESALPTWLWLLPATILLGGGFAIHRFRNRALSPTETDLTTRPQPLPVQDEAGDVTPVTPGLDSELTVTGELADGGSFEVTCQVSSHAINLVIGRGTADIPIDSPAVSRRHATLNGTAEELTLSDLGSSNGTSINGVPCLEGETMYVRPGDIIIAGNARFRFTIGPAGGEQAAE